MIQHSNILQQLEEGKISKSELEKAVEGDFSLLPSLILALSSTKPRVRYGAASALTALSVKHPAGLYPQMEFFIQLLDSNRRILIWNALAIIANLCPVDTEKKFDTVFDKYFGLLKNEYMVTVANVVGNSAQIANAKPYLVPKITKALLDVEKIQTTPHLTEECKKVISEKAIESFDKFFNKMSHEEKSEVLYFVKRYTKNPRKTLEKKANDFLKRWEGA